MEKTLFQIFKTPSSSFSQSSLKKVYYDLMKKVHPDASSAIPVREKEALSGFLSQAYAKLKDDYRRSVYSYSVEHNKNLVQRTFANVQDFFGTGDTLTVIDTAKDRVGCDRKMVDPEFLDRILSLEDAIEHSTPEELQGLERTVAEEIDKCRRNSTDLMHLVRWRYFNRLLESVRNKELGQC
ncbi:hypothetical protein NEDG_00208 [Nematocida displodere]|uniref:J domain-containing protein n=1 Tax=Nematocida displodere TaxID=1805483 RepID=A0A177EID7_9MICR|nr:hypothetical protein NEDG_00208 [Nematocida displodere]